MDNILSTIFPLPQQNLPISIKKNTVPTVAQDYNLNDNLSNAIAPKNFKAYKSDNELTLPPSPKDSIHYNPTCVHSKNKSNPKRLFKRNKCYMLYAPSQNMWGPVCGDSGYNANWTRGNTFANDYNFYKVFRRPTYKIDGAQYIKKNPVIVADNKYFPYPDYYNRFRPEFKSYPYFNLYKNGQPIYTYPYNTLNNYSPIVEGFSKNTLFGKKSICNVVGVSLLILAFFLMVRRPPRSTLVGSVRCV